jgi:cell division protein FtsB
MRENGTRDNKYLSSEDIAGVALAGVKELIKENQELKQMIEELETKIEKLESTR